MALNNPIGTKLYHPTLTGQDLIDTADFAIASYEESFVESKVPGGWSVITNELTNHGLENDDYGGDSGYYYSKKSAFLIGGSADAVLFENSDASKIVMSFRGSQEWLDFWDDIRPLGFDAHYAAMAEFISATQNYVESIGTIKDVIVVGHSLGAAMVELFMANHDDDVDWGVSFHGVAFASPEASYENSDLRVINIGHEEDPIYSSVGIRSDEGNAVKNLNLVFDNLTGGGTGFTSHSSLYYKYSTETLLSSQFYNETSRTSHVVISLTEEREQIREVAANIFIDNQNLILGRNFDYTLNDGKVLSKDDYLVGGNGDDYLEGFSGNDTLEGDDSNWITSGVLNSGGKDTMAGGEGKDTFLGTPEHLDGDTIVDLEVGDFIQLKGVDTADIIDNFTFYGIGSNVTLSFDEGILDIGGTTVRLTMDIPKGATLKLLEDRTEATIEVVARDGHDIAFVVDTTGSMWDDIDAVKAQATSIIEAIFAPERGLLNSRIAVVGYNDPDTRTFLSFTDQADVEDRKTAAINAINSLSANGGGDYPEMVYSGLLRALDGRAGEWREEALAHRIFLFGDAPAKDSELLARVLALAADIGIEVSASAETVEMSGAVSKTTLTLASASSDSSDPISVEIFTIVIGEDATTTAEFKNLSDKTGGEAFTSADASEIADVLFDAIQSGTGGNDVIIGNSRDNNLDGKAGDDDISGNDGDDTILGGAGDDLLKGNAGNDTILDGLGNNTIEGGTGSDEIRTLSGVNNISGGNDSDLIVGGFQADTIDAGSGDDVIIGDVGSFLGGSDILTGGAGNDTMMGGRGADTFIFNTNDGNDIIGEIKIGNVGIDEGSRYFSWPTGADFQSGIDHIQLVGFGTVNASNVMSSVIDGTNGAVFSAEGTSITFFGVTADQLTVDDFMFV